MKKTTTDKLELLIAAIEREGFQSTTRLTVIKKWLEGPGRTASFAAFVARKVLSRRGAAKDRQERELCQQAKELFGSPREFRSAKDRKDGDKLYDRLRSFQDEYRQTRWARVRTIHSMDLFLVEQAIGIILHDGRPEEGYKLAADLCVSYDPRHGTGLYKDCVNDLRDIVLYIHEKEAMEAAS